MTRHSLRVAIVIVASIMFASTAMGFGPPSQAGQILASDIDSQQITLTWTNNGGTGCAVFVKQGDNGLAAPVDDTEYTASTVFGQGDQIGTSGWYCVYDGTGATVTVTGLSASTTYRIMVCAYDALPDARLYNTDAGTCNPVNVATYAGQMIWSMVGGEAFSEDGIMYPSLTFMNHQPYVAYTAGEERRCYVKMFDGTDWQTVGGAPASSGQATNNSIVATAGTVCVSYCDWDEDRSPTVVKLNNGSWEVVGTAGISGAFSSGAVMAVGGGDIYVAFADINEWYQASLMKYDGMAWSYVGDPGFSADTVARISLACSDTTPYVAFMDTDCNDRLTVMKYDGMGWGNVGAAGISVGTSLCISLALSGDVPYVAYVDDGLDRRVTVKKFVNGDWEVVGWTGFTPEFCEDVCLVLDNGVPYIVFACGGQGQGFISKYNGTTWEMVGPAIPYPAGCRLAIDSGVPYVFGAVAEWNHRAVLFMPSMAITPTVQARDVVWESVSDTGASLHWTRGDGDKCAVFVKQGDAGSAAPVDGSTYTANVAYGSGTQIYTSGWYCVYNGTGTNVTVTGLSPDTTYRAMVCEYNGNAAQVRYLITTSDTNPTNQTTEPAEVVDDVYKVVTIFQPFGRCGQIGLVQLSLMFVGLGLMKQRTLR